MNINETPRETANRVVERLLDDDSPLNLERPIREARMPLREFSPSSTTPPKAWHTGAIPHKTSPQGARSAVGNAGKAWQTGNRPGNKVSRTGAASSMGTTHKAWKAQQQDKDTPEKIATSPGPVSYREALVRHTLARLEARRSMREDTANPATGGGMKGVKKK